MRRLLAFLDPLFGCSPLIIETHYRPVWQKPRPPGKQLACPPPVDARFPATAIHPSLRRCAHCQSAASPPSSPRNAKGSKYEGLSPLLLRSMLLVARLAHGSF